MTFRKTTREKTQANLRQGHRRVPIPGEAQEPLAHSVVQAMSLCLGVCSNIPIVATNWRTFFTRAMFERFWIPAIFTAVLVFCLWQLGVSIYETHLHQPSKKLPAISAFAS